MSLRGRLVLCREFQHMRVQPHRLVGEPLLNKATGATKACHSHTDSVMNQDIIMHRQHADAPWIIFALGLIRFFITVASNDSSEIARLLTANQIY